MQEKSHTLMLKTRQSICNVYKWDVRPSRTNVDKNVNIS